jgi:hypothetical protein
MNTVVTRADEVAAALPQQIVPNVPPQETPDELSAGPASIHRRLPTFWSKEKYAANVAATTESSLAATRAEVSASARRHKRTVDVAIFSMVAVTLIYTCVVQALVRLNDGNIDFWTKTFPVLTVLNLILVGASAAIVAVMQRNRLRTARRFTRALSADRSIESVGALVDLFKYDTLDAHETAKRGLTELLPKLRADQAALLTPEHRALLNTRLMVPPEELGHKDIRELFSNTTDREVEFRVAILKAYEQVGDEKALAVVTRLANVDLGPGVYSARGLQRVKAAAAECLPYLKFRVAKLTAQNSLLRGAAQEEASAGTLLRAASSVSPSDPAVLVRADAAPL